MNIYHDQPTQYVIRCTEYLPFLPSFPLKITSTDKYEPTNSPHLDNLLSGVTNTVGGLLGNVGKTVGDATSGLGSTVSNTTQGLGNTTSGLGKTVQDSTASGAVGSGNGGGQRRKQTAQNPLGLSQ